LEGNSTPLPSQITTVESRLLFRYSSGSVVALPSAG